MDRAREVGAVHGDRLSLHLVGPSCVVAEVLDGQVNVYTIGDVHRFAVVLASVAESNDSCTQFVTTGDIMVQGAAPTKDTG